VYDVSTKILDNKGNVDIDRPVGTAGIAAIRCDMENRQRLLGLGRRGCIDHSNPYQDQNATNIDRFLKHVLLHFYCPDELGIIHTPSLYSPD